MLEKSSKLTSNMCINIFVLKIFFYKDFCCYCSWRENTEFLQIQYCVLPASQYTQYFSNFFKHCSFVKQNKTNPKLC